MLNEIFKNVKADFGKLQKYGFENINNVYTYSTKILGGQFLMNIYIDSAQNISTKLIDLDINEEYTLHLIKDAVGEFVGKVRENFENVLYDIKNKCFFPHIFKSKQAQEIIDYVSKTYGDELEYLWEKFPSNAVWRRKDNKKWYGALLTVAENKLSKTGSDIIEIIDLRIETETLEKLIDNQRYFRGYHMNKKHWFTICLDNSVDTKIICNFLDKSYTLAKGK